MKIKILTYNIHKGFDWSNRNYFIKDIKDLIKESAADIVFLQEVVGQSLDYQKKGLIDAQFEYIADAAWPHYSYFKNSVYDHGHHGNLILSKFPIQNWDHVNISTNTFEQRGLLFCQINLLGHNLYALCTHLNLLNSGRLLQYNKIKNFIQDLNIPKNAPIIVAGDFNDWNRQASKIFEKDLTMTEAYKNLNGAYAKTFPAAFPILCLDRVYTRNTKIVNATTLKPTKKGHFSDHLPLLCELEINDVPLF
jgi:endonuclease/exonuclease/phosphatase family metal-dependent hydrolase